MHLEELTDLELSELSASVAGNKSLDRLATAIEAEMEIRHNLDLVEDNDVSKKVALLSREIQKLERRLNHLLRK